MSDAFPGLQSGLLSENWGSHYVQLGESRVGVGASGKEVASLDDTSFTMLLAIFFPSVTGIMAGSNRSGDLKDASASIPKGTILAISTTSSVYILCTIFLGACVEGSVLRDKLGESIGGQMVIAEASWPSKWIVVLGALLSCTGAGLQSLTGAPYVLGDPWPHRASSARVQPRVVVRPSVCSALFTRVVGLVLTMAAAAGACCVR